MLPANDQDPFSPTENNISIVNKRRSILNASAGGIRWPYRKSFQSEQLHLLSESSSTNASSLHSTQGRIMIQPGFFFKAFFRRFRRKKSEALIPSSCLFSAASRGSAIRSNLTIWLSGTECHIIQLRHSPLSLPTITYRKSPFKGTLSASFSLLLKFSLLVEVKLFLSQTLRHASWSLCHQQYGNLRIEMMLILTQECHSWSQVEAPWQQLSSPFILCIRRWK